MGKQRQGDVLCEEGILKTEDIDTADAVMKGTAQHGDNARKLELRDGLESTALLLSSGDNGLLNDVAQAQDETVNFSYAQHHTHVKHASDELRRSHMEYPVQTKRHAH